MAYPKITLPAANAILSSVGVEIYKPANGLGYYEAVVFGVTYSHQRLGILVSQIMKIHFQKPRALPEITPEQEDQDLADYLAERRHVQAGIL